MRTRALPNDCLLRLLPMTRMTAEFGSFTCQNTTTRQVVISAHEPLPHYSRISNEISQLILRHNAILMIQPLGCGGVPALTSHSRNIDCPIGTHASSTPTPANSQGGYVDGRIENK